MTDDFNSVAVHDSSTSGNRDLYWIVKLIAACLLLLGAVSKLVRFVEICAGNGLLSDAELLRVVIAVEAGLSVWIACVPAKISRWTILTVFGVFAGLSCYAIISGMDCNCIAKAIPTPLMMTMDLGVIALALFVPIREQQHRVKFVPVVVGCVFAAGLFFAMASQRSPTPEVAQSDDLQLSYLLADSLVGQQWPIDSRYDSQLKVLEEGNWLVLVVRYDCDHCRELVETEFENPERHRAQERTAVFIAGKTIWPFTFDHVSMSPSAVGEIDWNTSEPFVASPAVFTLKNGQVTAAADGDASTEFLQNLFRVAD